MTVQPRQRRRVDASSLAGVARSVEYLGSTVQVGIDVVGLETLSAVVPEARFDAAPVQPGQPVVLSWTPEDVHVLGRLRSLAEGGDRRWLVRSERLLDAARS